MKIMLHTYQISLRHFFLCVFMQQVNVSALSGPYIDRSTFSINRFFYIYVSMGRYRLSVEREAWTIKTLLLN